MKVGSRTVDIVHRRLYEEDPASIFYHIDMVYNGRKSTNFVFIERMLTMKDEDVRRYRLMKASKLNEIWWANISHLGYYMDIIQMITKNGETWRSSYLNELARCYKKASIISERLEILEGILKRSYRQSDEINY